MRVLVIEDDEVFSTLIDTLLTQRGHKAVKCVTGTDALEAFARYRPPLILLDWNLPDTDGPTLCSQLRALPGGEETVILMVTGRDGTSHVMEALEAGANDYLQKPFDQAAFSVRLAVAERQVASILSRVAAERALRESEERFELAVRGTSAGIWSWDVTTGSLYLAPRFYELTGYSADQHPRPDQCYSLVHPDHLERVIARVQGHLLRREPYRVDCQLRMASGEWRWFEITGQALWDADGNPTRIAGSVTDIDARIQSEQAIAQYYVEIETARHEAELRASELEHRTTELEGARLAALEATRQKSAFLATMSHEIRTPMSGVLGMVELLLGSPLEAEQREYAATIRSSAETLLALINDILDFSKIEAGKLTLETIDFDLHSVVEDAVMLLATKAAEKGLEVNLPIAFDVPTAVRGDPTRLQQVIVNLLGNAIKFTSTGHVGVVTQLQDCADGYATISLSVQDSGIGLTPDAISRLFRPFTQADDATARQYGGTGLGLAICKRIVEQMGGEIGVESQPGQGSTFWFTVRLALGSGADTGADKPLHGVRVLCVEPASNSRLNLHSAVLNMGGIPHAHADCDSIPTDACCDVVLADRNCLPLAPSLVTRLGNPPIIELTSVTDNPQNSTGRRLLRPIRRRALRDIVLDALRGAATQSPSDASLPIAAQSARLLVADDNDTNRRVIRATLRKLGYDPEMVTNGQQAVEAVQARTFDLVLMDCQMPEMDGFQATAAIRAAESAGGRLPIVALTANAMAGDRERCLAAGMDDYLAKPVRADDLQRVLSRWLPRVDAAATTSAAPPSPTETPLPTGTPAAATESVADAIDRGGLDALRELLSDPDTGDESFHAMIDEYLADARHACDAARAAIERLDANELSRVAHKLKGSSATFGAPLVRAISLELETLGRGGVTDGAAPLVADLTREVGRVDRALEDYRR